MHFITPTEISPAIWQGNLVAHTGRLIPSNSVPPAVSLGNIEVWPVTNILEKPGGILWLPPTPHTEYWLLRMGFTLHQEAQVSNVTEAQLTLYIHPPDANLDSACTYNLFPTHLNTQTPQTMQIILRADLSFIGEAGFRRDQPYAQITYHQTFPIIRGQGIGRSTAYWIFKPQAATPLEGCQFVYAIVAKSAFADNIELSLELITTVNTLRGPIRFHLPSTVQAQIHAQLSRRAPVKVQ